MFNVDQKEAKTMQNLVRKNTCGMTKATKISGNRIKQNPKDCTATTPRRRVSESLVLTA